MFLNRVEFQGNLTKNPEAFGSDVTICRFDTAVAKMSKDKEKKESDFFTITAFGKMADYVMENFTKGNKAIVLGKVHQNNYKNKEGKMVYGFQFVADSVVKLA